MLKPRPGRFFLDFVPARAAKVTRLKIAVALSLGRPKVELEDAGNLLPELSLEPTKVQESWVRG